MGFLSLKVKKCLKCKEQVVSKKIQVIWRKAKWDDGDMLLHRETSRQENRKDSEFWKQKCRFQLRSCIQFIGHTVNHSGDRRPDALPNLYGEKEKHDLPVRPQWLWGVHQTPWQMPHVQKTCWQTTYKTIQLLRSISCQFRPIILLPLQMWCKFCLICDALSDLWWLLYLKSRLC